MKPPYDILATLNQLGGVSVVNKFGANNDIDTTSDPEDVWEGGGLYPFPAAAQKIQIVSASTDDDGSPAGTGAQTVTIQGLGSNWELQSETVTLDGTTTVETTNDFIRMFRAFVAASGTGNTNAGTLTFTWKTDATTAAIITAGNAQTLMAIYTVPMGYTAAMTNMYATINSSLNNATGSRADIELFERKNADSASASWNIKHIEAVVIDGDSRVDHRWFPYRKITEKTDIVIRVANVTDNDTSISAGFDLLLIDNDTIDSWS